MFGIFEKKGQPASAMDALRDTAYEKGAKSVANLPEAIKLADEVLLRGAFEKQSLSRRATDLNNGPLPYSTHDLAAAVALAALRSVPVAERPRLMEIQMMARMTVGSWLTDGKIAPLLAKAFEETLYKYYDPSVLGGESTLNPRRAEPASPVPKAPGARKMPQLGYNGRRIVVSAAVAAILTMFILGVEIFVHTKFQTLYLASQDHSKDSLFLLISVRERGTLVEVPGKGFHSAPPGLTQGDVLDKLRERYPGGIDERKVIWVLDDKEGAFYYKLVPNWRALVFLWACAFGAFLFGVSVSGRSRR